MFIAAYGAMVAYLLIIKDTVPVVIGSAFSGGDGDANENGTFLERELVMVVTSLLICLPLSMARDFSSLAFTSFLSITADVLMVIFVAVASPVRQSVQNAGGLGAVLKSNWIDSGFFVGFGVLTLAMTVQHSAFIVAGSLHDLTPPRWAIVTCASLSLSCTLCLVLGVTGYLGFLEDTQGDILNNFPPDTLASNGARALLAITMFFTYPMEAFVARHVLVQLLWGGDMDGYVTTTDPTTGETVTLKSKRCHVLNRRHQVTLAIYLLSLLPALIVDDLGG
jgi:solute carrier family 38 (sodium-coupled neutral amino acid transporter), member 11